jgi:hypothetical protein
LLPLNPRQGLVVASSFKEVIQSGVESAGGQFRDTRIDPCGNIHETLQMSGCIPIAMSMIGDDSEALA